MAGQKLYEQVYQNIDNLLQVEKHSLNIKKLAENCGFLLLQVCKRCGRGWMNFVFTHRYPSSVMRAFLDFVMEKVGFLAV